jgi:hypothetical protein
MPIPFSSTGKIDNVVKRHRGNCRLPKLRELVSMRLAGYKRIDVECDAAVFL